MAGNYGNPAVKAWMREHEAETKRVEKLYNALKGKSVAELEHFADLVGVSVPELRARYASSLITAIAKAGVDKALAIIEGQGVLTSR